MKKTIVLILAVAAMAMFTACKTPTGTSETPAQIAAQVCPPVQTAVTSLQALNGLPSDAEDILTKSAPIVDAVCKAGATVDFGSLARLNQTVLPAMIGVVKASPLAPDEQDKVILDIAAAQIILTTVEAVQAAQAGGVAPANPLASAPATPAK